MDRERTQEIERICREAMTLPLENVKAFMPGGGYVFNNVHNIQGGVPPENIVAMYDTVYESGRYTEERA